MKKTILFLLMCCASFYVLAQSIPPVSDPHCAYCNVNLRTATSHISGCPYYVAPSSTSSEASSSSGGKSSSRSSSSTVDPALSAAALGCILRLPMQSDCCWMSITTFARSTFRTIWTSFVGSSTEGTLAKHCSTGLWWLLFHTKINLGITLSNH